MLDIGFSELLVIGGVALVVLGPEKLAVVARSAGKWTTKAQRYVNDVKADIAREGELAELRKLKEEMESTGRSVGHSLRASANEVQQDFNAIGTTLKSEFEPISPNTEAVVDSSQVEASIQASLDAAPSGNMYTPPAIDMTGRYQDSLNSTLAPPPLDDPIAQRMELEALQDDVHRLEQRLAELKHMIGQAVTASTDAKLVSGAAA